MNGQHFSDQICFRHTIDHVKASGLVVAPPARQAVASKVFSMTFVHEDTSNASRSRVQVLVRTPAREIDVPVVQLNRNIAGSVGQIPTNDAALRVNSRVSELNILLLR